MRVKRGVGHYVLSKERRNSWKRGEAPVRNQGKEIGCREDDISLGK